MRTARQIAASRANGAKSRGAATPAGRARIVAANIRSGVFANSPVPSGEDPDELARLPRNHEDHATHPTPPHPSLLPLLTVSHPLVPPAYRPRLRVSAFHCPAHLPRVPPAPPPLRPPPGIHRSHPRRYLRLR